MRILIVHNLKSGMSSIDVFDFVHALMREDDEIVILGLDSSSQGQQELRDAESFDLVVVSGGDGTVTSLLYELRDRNVLTCVFPSGTANLVFENLANAPEPASIAKACRDGYFVRADFGEIAWKDTDGNSDSRGFGLMAGSGYDAVLMREAIPNKQIIGEAAYFTAALANAHPKVEHFTITVDGETFERDGIACIVANTAKMQADIQIVPDCSMSDGKLDVIVLETSDAVQLLVPIFTGLFDKQAKGGRPFIEHFSGREIEVRSDSPIPMQVDGDTIPGMVMGYKAHVIPQCNKLVVDQASPYFDRRNRVELG